MNKAYCIAEYLHKNYYDDGEKLAQIPIMGAMLNHATAEEIPSLIDKVAIMNGIKKSYPPSRDISVIA